MHHDLLRLGQMESLRNMPFAVVYFSPWSSSGAGKASLSVLRTTPGIKQSQNQVLAPHLTELRTFRSKMVLQLFGSDGRLVPCVIYKTLNPAALCAEQSLFLARICSPLLPLLFCINTRFTLILAGVGAVCRPGSWRLCSYGFFCP